MERGEIGERGEGLWSGFARQQSWWGILLSKPDGIRAGIQ